MLIVRMNTHENGLVSYKVAGYFDDPHESPPSSNEVAQLIAHILRGHLIGVYTFSDHWLIGMPTQSVMFQCQVIDSCVVREY